MKGVRQEYVVHRCVDMLRQIVGVGLDKDNIGRAAAFGKSHLGRLQQLPVDVNRNNTADRFP